jgi:hypothetical protein
LLLSIRDIVQQAGARIAFPSQIVYLNSNTLDMPARTTLESVERDAPAIKSW